LTISQPYIGRILIAGGIHKRRSALKKKIGGGGAHNSRSFLGTPEFFWQQLSDTFLAGSGGGIKRSSEYHSANNMVKVWN